MSALSRIFYRVPNGAILTLCRVAASTAATMSGCGVAEAMLRATLPQQYACSVWLVSEGFVLG